MALYGLASTVGALAGGLAADRWGRVPTLMATYVLRGLGALALALPVMPAGWFYGAVALAAGPIFATVTINNVQMFELVGPTRRPHPGRELRGPSSRRRGQPLRQWSGLRRDRHLSPRVRVLGVVMLLALLPAACTHPEGGPPRPPGRAPWRAAHGRGAHAQVTVHDVAVLRGMCGTWRGPVDAAPRLP